MKDDTLEGYDNIQKIADLSNRERLVLDLIGDDVDVDLWVDADPESGTYGQVRSYEEWVE